MWRATALKLTTTAVTGWPGTKDILSLRFLAYIEKKLSASAVLKTKDTSIQIAGLLPRSLHETAQEDPELESKGFRDDVTSPPGVRVRVFCLTFVAREGGV